MLRERRFRTGTVELNYAEGPPNGPPFVIIHGGAGSWRYAEGLIDLLVDRWHVFAPDLRGHGRSGHVPGRYRSSDYAGDVAAFLAGAVGDPAVLYGHSLGGEVGSWSPPAIPRRCGPSSTATSPSRSWTTRRRRRPTGR